MLAFVKKPGLLATDEHAAPFTIQAVRASNVELVATVHGLPVSIVPNEPAKGRNPLSCGLHIDYPFNDATHIIGVPNDAMELERMLSRVSSQGPALSGHVKIKFQL